MAQEKSTLSALLKAFDNVNRSEEATKIQTILEEAIRSNNYSTLSGAITELKTKSTMKEDILVRKCFPIAARLGNLNILKELSKNNPSVSLETIVNDEKNLAQIAITVNNLDILQWLMTEKQCFTDKGNDFALIAAESNKIEILTWLIDSKKCTNIQEIVKFALTNERTDILQILHQHNISFIINNQNPILFAIENSKFKILGFLVNTIKLSIDCIDANWEKVLIENAAKKNDVTTLQWWIQQEQCKLDTLFSIINSYSTFTGDNLNTTLFEACIVEIIHSKPANIAMAECKKLSAAPSIEKAVNRGFEKYCAEITPAQDNQLNFEAINNTYSSFLNQNLDENNKNTVLKHYTNTLLQEIYVINIKSSDGPEKHQNLNRRRIIARQILQLLEQYNYEDKAIQETAIRVLRGDTDAANSGGNKWTAANLGDLLEYSQVNNCLSIRSIYDIILSQAKLILKKIAAQQALSTETRDLWKRVVANFININKDDALYQLHLQTLASLDNWPAGYILDVLDIVDINTLIHHPLCITLFKQIVSILKNPAAIPDKQFTASMPLQPLPADPSSSCSSQTYSPLTLFYPSNIAPSATQNSATPSLLPSSSTSSNTPLPFNSPTSSSSCSSSSLATSSTAVKHSSEDITKIYIDLLTKQKTLEQCESNFNDSDKEGTTLLHFIASNKTLSATFVKTYTPINCQQPCKYAVTQKPNKKKQYPLHFAAASGNEIMVSLLFNDKIAISEDDKGRTPLDYAIESKNYNVIALFIARMATQLKFLAKIFQKLEAHFSDVVDEKGNTLLHLIANDEILASCFIKYYLRSNTFNPDNKSSSSSNTSEKDDNKVYFNPKKFHDVTFQAIQKLYEHRGKSLEKAHQFNMCYFNKKLLPSSGFPAIKAVNQEGKTSLHLAAIRGDYQMVLLLFDSQTAITRDTNQQTPIDYAISNGHYDVAEFLIKNTLNIRYPGGDINTMKLDYLAALEGLERLNERRVPYFCVKSGYITKFFILEYFILLQKYDIQQTGRIWSPLILATMNNFPDLFDWLNQRGCNLYNNQHHLALQACFTNNLKTLQWLSGGNREVFSLDLLTKAAEYLSHEAFICIANNLPNSAFSKKECGDIFFLLQGDSFNDTSYSANDDIDEPIKVTQKPQFCTQPPRAYYILQHIILRKIEIGIKQYAEWSKDVTVSSFCTGHGNVYKSYQPIDRSPHAKTIFDYLNTLLSHSQYDAFCRDYELFRTSFPADAKLEINHPHGFEPTKTYSYGFEAIQRVLKICHFKYLCCNPPTFLDQIPGIRPKIQYFDDICNNIPFDKTLNDPNLPIKIIKYIFEFCKKHNWLNIEHITNTLFPVIFLRIGAVIARAKLQSNNSTPNQLFEKLLSAVKITGMFSTDNQLRKCNNEILMRYNDNNTTFSLATAVDFLSKYTPKDNLASVLKLMDEPLKNKLFDQITEALDRLVELEKSPSTTLDHSTQATYLCSQSIVCGKTTQNQTEPAVSSTSTSVASSSTDLFTH